MKLIFKVQEYADRRMIQVAYGRAVLYFAGRQPAMHSLVLVEMPGLDQPTSKAIVEWLTMRANPLAGIPVIGALVPRRQITELPENIWRPATLDDMLVAENYQQVVWFLPESFTLRDFSAFADHWLPQAQSRLRGVLSHLSPESGRPYAEALAPLQPFLERISAVIAQMPRRTAVDYSETIKQVEKAQWALMRAKGQGDRMMWLEVAARFQTREVILDMLVEVAHTLQHPATTQDEMQAVLDVIRRAPTLKGVTEHAPGFWRTLSPFLRLEQNVWEERIDISQAREITALLNWDLLLGRRVGRVVPGRAVLVVNDKTGRTTYIAGARKLKFQAKRAGGRLRKFGNTLVLADPDAHALHQALVEIELLDTLANVAPDQALARIADRDLPPDHPIYRAAQAARRDPRHARILADLLIELVVGVDADIARRLMRAQSRANRR